MASRIGLTERRLDAMRTWLQTCRPSVAALAFALLTLPAALPAAIDLTFLSVATGVSVTGSGAATGSLNFGTISGFGPLPANVTRTSTDSDYTVTTDVGVRVTKESESSTTYTLRARLLTPSAFGWRVGSTDMSTAFSTVSSLRFYATTYSTALRIVIPTATTTGLNISQQLEYLAIAN